MNRAPIIVLVVMSLAFLACNLLGNNTVGQTQEADSNSAPQDTLQVPQTEDGELLEPGGSVVGSDGVTLAAPVDSLDEGVSIIIESVSSPLEDVPFPGDVGVVGSFYQLRAAKDTFTGRDEYLVIGLPVSDNKEHLAIAVLVPEAFVDDQEPSGSGDVWSILDGFHDADSNLLFGALSMIPQQGMTVAVVTGSRFETHPTAALETINRGDGTVVNIAFQQLQPDFTAQCHAEFDDPDVPEVCNSAILTAAENSLQDAYFDYTGMGFNLPRLYRVPETITWDKGIASVVPGPYLISIKPCSEHKGTLGQHLGATKKIWACISEAGFNEVVNDTIRHEYFHSTQYSYPKILNGDNPAWFIESMASASENSNTSFSRSDLRGVRDIDLSLIGKPQRYLTEDFWIYLGIREGQGLIMMEQFLENGGKPSQVDQTLQNMGLGTFGAVYWDWAKNQAFEKQVNLGGNNSSPTCGLSTNAEGGYYALNLTDSNPTGAPPNIEFKLEVPPADQNFSLDQMTAKIYEIEFKALANLPYQTVVETNRTNPALRVKYYRKNPLNPMECWAWPENLTLNVGVNAGQDVTFYALVANTSMTDSITGRISFQEQEVGLTITSPGDGAVFLEGETILFQAVVTGPGNRTSVDVNVFWKYVRYDGVPVTIGNSKNGEDFLYSGLCDGTYTITSEGVDAIHGDYGSDSVSFQVQDLGGTNPPSQCDVTIDIIEPVTLSTISIGQSLDLKAVIDDDHPETDEPLYPVLWRVGGREGRIIGQGLEVSTKVAGDMNSIWVTYGGAYDLVTLGVIEGNEPPVVRIQTPNDEEIFRQQTARIDVDFVAVAIDPEDGHISEDIIWEYRLSGSTERMTYAGEGPQVTISFPAGCTLTSYEIRARVIDQARTNGQDQVTIYVRGPEC